MSEMFNALTFDEKIMTRAGSKRCSRVFYAGRNPIVADGVENFLYVDDGFAGRLRGDLYLTTVMLPDKLLDDVIDHALTTKCKVMINACSTLDEVGTCDKRYGATPVGLAHKYGLLDNEAYIAGGVYLDKDDIELIVQSGSKVILTPSTSMGEGHGVPPLRMLASLGADVRLGTGLAEYNPDGDLLFERRLIALAVSGVNCTKHAVGVEFLDTMLGSM